MGSFLVSFRASAPQHAVMAVHLMCGEGFQMHGRFPLTAGTGDHSTWIPQVSMAATLR